MIWILRHISIHLWITTLVSIPLIFYVLPGLSRIFPAINPFFTGGITLAFVVVGLGFLMDKMASKAVTGLIKEGQAWERSGILNRAEKNYINALRILDTFLLWPFSVKKTTRVISNALAKFRLNTANDNQNFKLGTAVYLKMNPKDEDIARLWLADLRRSSFVSSFDQDVLSLLVETHLANKRLSTLMMDIFLGLERQDFIARRLYEQVGKDPALEKMYSKKIQRLMGTPEKTLEQEVAFLQPGKKIKEKMSRRKTMGSFFLSGVTCLKTLGSHIGSVLSFLTLSVGRIILYLKENEKIGFYLKTGFIGLLSMGLLFFMINTMAHMVNPVAVENEQVNIEIQIPRPFTIQVAAYLKQRHADQYLGALKKQGIDARIKKVAGGGKTWFVVRVSKFVDKSQATAYGQKLKQQKIIDDFFVNNL